MTGLGPLVDAVQGILGWSNHIVRAHLVWLVGGAVALASLVSGFKYRADLQWTTDTNVSTAPLDGDDKVSVLVPAWNEKKTIGRAIDGFKSVSYEPRELIVCAGGQDGTYEQAVAAANGSDRVQVIKQTMAMNKQAALNACLKKSSGDVLYLVDGDCILDDEAWNSVLRPVLEDDERVTTGTSRPLDNQWGRLLPTYQHIKEEYERSRRAKYVRGLLGRNTAIRREVMNNLGSFEENIQAGTDYNLAKRLLSNGEEIRFVVNSRIQSEYPETIREYIRQQSRWLRNVFFLGRRWGEHGEARTTLVTCSVGLGMLVAPIVGLVLLPILVIWLGLVAFGVLSRVRWIQFFRRKRELQVPYMMIVIGVGLMFVEFAAWTFTGLEIIIPSRRRKW